LIDAKIVACSPDARLSTRHRTRFGCRDRRVKRLERLHSRGSYSDTRDIGPGALGWDVEAIIGITTQQGEILQSLVNT